MVAESKSDDRYSGTTFGRNFRKRKEHIIKTKLKSSKQPVSRKILGTCIENE
jgi:hypothetical protein